MRVGGGLVDVNSLQTNTGQFRNQDFGTNERLAYIGSQLIIGVAGQFSHIELANVTSSGRVLILDGFNCSALTLGTFIVTATPGAPVGTLIDRLRPTRFHLSILTQAEVLIYNNVAPIVGSDIMQMRVEANVVYEHRFISPIQIPENWRFVVRHSAFATSFYVSFWVRELLLP